MLRYLEIKKIESGLERNVSRIKVLTWSNVGSLLSRNCRRRPLVGELAEFPSSDSRAPASCFHQCLLVFGLVWFGVSCFHQCLPCRSKSMLIQLSITSFPRRNQIIFCLTSGGGTATPTVASPYEIFNIEMFAHTQCTMNKNMNINMFLFQI